jgi:hypothetical protein
VGTQEEFESFLVSMIQKAPVRPTVIQFRSDFARSGIYSLTSADLARGLSPGR